MRAEGNPPPLEARAREPPSHRVEPDRIEQDHVSALRRALEVHEHGRLLAQVVQRALHRRLLHGVRAAARRQALVVLGLDLGSHVHRDLEAQRLPGREPEIPHGRRDRGIETGLVHRLPGDAGHEGLEELALDRVGKVLPHHVERDPPRPEARQARPPLELPRHLIEA